MQALLTRPLEGRYPYLSLDATMEEARDSSRVINKALIVAAHCRGPGFAVSSAYRST